MTPQEPEKGGVMIGPGKYDKECTAARQSTRAEGLLLIVVNGCKGSGFSCQASPAITVSIPKILRSMADEIEAREMGKFE